MTMEGGLDETVEERVRRGRTALELRVELRGDEVGVAGQLDDLDELAVRGEAARHEPRRLDGLLRLARVCELIAVAVPFRDG